MRVVVHVLARWSGAIFVLVREVNNVLLETKLAQLPAGLASRQLRDRVNHADDRMLFRINPYAFAEEAGVPADRAIELLLRASALGLVRVEWSLVCRGCGECAASHFKLSELASTFHCAACATDRMTNLHEQVEVGFTVHPEIRALRYAHPESLELEDFFFGYKFSSNILVRGEGVRLVDYLRTHTQILTRLAPGGRATADVVLEEGWVVGSPRAKLTVIGARVSDTREVELVFDGRAFEPRPTNAPGPVRISVRNDSANPLPVLLYFTPIVTYFDYVPLLSGQRLLNTDDFRRYLGTEVVRPGTGIPTRDNTLLFSDLSGSTAIYDRIGDAAAFELVSAHFESLARMVTRHSGVVVKTIGDALMASFSHPADAVRAALEMGDALVGLTEPLSLKIGIHRGDCLVVNIRDSVDYFGQMVNVAARVQSCARAGDVCLTAAVHDDPEVLELLKPFGDIPAERHLLRGIGDEQVVYRLRPA